MLKILDDSFNRNVIPCGSFWDVQLDYFKGKMAMSHTASYSQPLHHFNMLLGRQCKFSESND